MMENRLLHTPEGVRDLYGEEYLKKLSLQNVLYQKIKSYGYMDIMTPTFEFFDVYSKEIGTTPSKELYKFFDKENNTLVMRPDFTPSVARAAAKYFMENNQPARLCYLGNTFTNSSDLQGKLKEVTQIGAECIGDDSVEADAEMISLVIEALLKAGLSDFQVSIGAVEYFKGICESAGIMESVELELREQISNKNYFGTEEILTDCHLDSETRQQIIHVTELFGTEEILDDALKNAGNERSIRAVCRLKNLYEMLVCYGFEKYVTFDFGMLSKYHYYTGIIFRAYTFGTGDAIVKGGRYDGLLQKFGKESPAIGFAIVIDQLMSAMMRQKIAMPVISNYIPVLYDQNSVKEAVVFAQKLRQDGYEVELIKEREGITWENRILPGKEKLIQKAYVLKDGREPVIVYPKADRKV